MQSTITGSYIIFGSWGKHSKKANKNKSWIGANQVQVSSLVPGDEEILISIMDTMTLEDMDSNEVQQESDWLDVDASALVCSTSSFSQANLPNNHQSQAQENTYSSLFIPDYDTVKAQQIISNSLKIRSRELNHKIAQRMIIILALKHLVRIIN